MNVPIKVKRSFTSGNVPSSLELGELAINIVDRRFWIGTASGIVELFAVGDFVQKTGDTMTGNLIIDSSMLSIVRNGYHINLRKAFAGSSAELKGYELNQPNDFTWTLGLLNPDNNFQIGRAGERVGTATEFAAFTIYRGTGGVMSPTHAGINFGNDRDDTTLFLTTGGLAGSWYNSRIIGRRRDSPLTGTANPRWTLNLADNTPEPRDSSNGGSNLYIARHADDGSEIDRPIAIDRATGQVLINGSPVRTDFGGANVSTDVQPPADPSPGDLWFDPVRAQLYIWFDDGDSQQWVVTVNQPGGGGGGAVDPSTLISADASNQLVEGSDSLLYVPPAGPQMGVTNGSVAAAGQVGEVLTAQTGTPVFAANSNWSSTAIGTLAITAGDWDVWATHYLWDNIGGNPFTGSMRIWLSAPSAPPVTGTGAVGTAVPGLVNAASRVEVFTAPIIVRTASAVTVTLTATSNFTTTTTNRSWFTNIWARRRR